MTKNCSLSVKRVLVESSNGGGGCSGGGECPTVYELSDGSIAIQGFKLEAPLKDSVNLPLAEDMVMIPRDFLDKILKSFNS